MPRLRREAVLAGTGFCSVPGSTLSRVFGESAGAGVRVRAADKAGLAVLFFTAQGSCRGMARLGNRVALERLVLAC